MIELKTLNIIRSGKYILAVILYKYLFTYIILTHIFAYKMME